MNGYILIYVCIIINLSYSNAYYKLYDFDSNQANMILNEHNRLRALEPATNMQAMVWDWNLASIAKDWASRCAAMHRPGSERTNRAGYNVIGENIWWSTETFLRGDLAAVIKDFYDEKSFYSFSSLWCQPGQMCGHYTQVVWANSCAVGCAAAYCDHIYLGRGIDTGHLIVCNYGPGGNYVGQQPYTYGNPCASCPGTCQNGLCPSSCAGTPSQPAPAPPPPVPAPPPPAPVEEPKKPVQKEIISIGCSDQHANCASWSTQGECEKNSVFMTTYCKNSCKISCTEAAPTVTKSANCVDRENLCPFWASLGECNVNGVWMNNNCYSSCHKSECNNPAPVATSGCTDLNWQCNFWASLGECTTNAFYMRWKCPKSCSLC